MLIRTLIIVLLTSGAARGDATDDAVKALPAAVQKTITAESMGKHVVRVDKKQNDGHTRYKIILKSSDEMQRRLFIDENGTLLRLKNDVIFSSVPPSVHQTAETGGKGAKFVRSTKISHDGKTEWEVEYDVSGRSRELLIDADGKLERIEEVVTAATLPATVKRAVDKEVGSGKIRKVEAITETGKPTVYEVQFDASGRSSEVTFAGDGKVLERE
jgi:hypothetical protein